MVSSAIGVMTSAANVAVSQRITPCRSSVTDVQTSCAFPRHSLTGSVPSGVVSYVSLARPRVSLIFSRGVAAGCPGASRRSRRLFVSAAEESQTAPAEVTATEATPTAPAVEEPKSTIDIVRAVIANQLAIPVAQVEPHTKFVDLGADSLDTVEIMMTLEEKFKVTIEDEGTEKIATVKDASDLIESVTVKGAK